MMKIMYATNCDLYVILLYRFPQQNHLYRSSVTTADQGNHNLYYCVVVHISNIFLYLEGLMGTSEILITRVVGNMQV